MCHISKSRLFLFDLYYLVTWDDLDLYYGHKAQEMILLTNVRDTIHADSLALFELNIEILLADITKPEKSNIFTLPWPVTSLVTPRSLKFVFFRHFFQGFEMPLEFLESVQYIVSEIRGGLEIVPPPVERVIKIPQWGAG